MTSAWGAHFRTDDPDIRFFRRVRSCSECNELFATAEMPEELMWQLVELRALVAELDSDAAKAEGAARTIRRKLRKVRR